MWHHLREGKELCDSNKLSSCGLVSLHYKFISLVKSIFITNWISWSNLSEFVNLNEVGEYYDNMILQHYFRRVKYLGLLKAMEEWVIAQ